MLSISGCSEHTNVDNSSVYSESNVIVNETACNNTSTLEYEVPTTEVIVEDDLVYTLPETLQIPLKRQVTAFLLKDKSDKKSFGNCLQAVYMVKQNAVSNNIKCGIAYVYMMDGTYYAVNCFDTSDCGIIYTDSTQKGEDILVNCVEGKRMEFEGIVKKNTNWKSMSEITQIDIYWDE